MKALCPFILTTALAAPLAAFAPARPALAQGTAINMSVRVDPKTPVEVTSRELTVDRQNGRAVFTGDVVAVQGDVKMLAPRAEVTFGTNGEGIQTVHATGGVTLITPTEAAEGREGLYTVTSGNMVMTGDVLLTQPETTIAGERMVYNLNTGTGVMEGRVKTIFTPAPKAQN